jgi:hypothetical protein
MFRITAIAIVAVIFTGAAGISANDEVSPSASEPKPLEEVLGPAWARQQQLDTDYRRGIIIMGGGGILSTVGMFIAYLGINNDIGSEDSNRESDFCHTFDGSGGSSAFESCEDTAQEHRKARAAIITGAALMTTGFTFLIIGIRKMGRGGRNADYYLDGAKTVPSRKRPKLSLFNGSNTAGIGIQF